MGEIRVLGPKDAVPDPRWPTAKVATLEVVVVVVVLRPLGRARVESKVRDKRPDDGPDLEEAPHRPRERDDDGNEVPEPVKPFKSSLSLDLFSLGLNCVSLIFSLVCCLHFPWPFKTDS